jgi:hypothetical protein
MRDQESLDAVLLASTEWFPMGIGKLAAIKLPSPHSPAPAPSPTRLSPR